MALAKTALNRLAPLDTGVNNRSTPSGSTAIGNGLYGVEFDADRERFQTRDDRTERTASLAIVEMIPA